MMMHTSIPSQPRLLVVGDGVASTGFARVAHSIITRLYPDYEVHHLGINYYGDPHDYPWPIYPARNGGDPFGAGRLKELIERLRPQLVLLINDLWILGDYMQILRAYRDTLKIVCYCPIETGPVDPLFVARLAGAHCVVAYTAFGKQAIDTSMELARQKEPTLDLPATAVIPHGVDTATFFAYADRPLPQLGLHSRLQAKQALIPRLPDPEDSFIVLNGNRNQPRKRIDLTIAGFARFAQGKPENVLLYLHMGVEDAGWNVLRLAEHFGIQDRLIISSLSNTIPALPDTHLNLIYNACDVGLNTATGEGWGLVHFEHAATGAAQVMTSHGVSRELWAGAALFIEPVVTLINPNISNEAHIVSPQDVAAALERLYQDRDLLRRMQAAAQQHACDPRYSWDVIAQQWRVLFATVAEECVLG